MIRTNSMLGRCAWREALCLLCLFVAARCAAETANNPAAATAAPAEATASAETDELSISADHMEMHLDGHTAELSGNVLIEDSTMKLSAEKMMVYLDDDNKLQRVNATGNVTVRKLDGSESATGDTGSYDAKDDMIVLEGNCVILQGKNAIRGNRAIYNRKDQVIKLERATLTIQMKKSSGADGTLGTLLDGKGKDGAKEEKSASAGNQGAAPVTNEDEKGAAAP
ncbi:MAG: hypothetical protein GX945_05290 [Lentisphaerae bacterium]|jgi:lipopolysaccharide export system protein LptA|nr:hypothetical protein [Lentisphaerota bacterium]